jgi:hypothetical protein
VYYEWNSDWNMIRTWGPHWPLTSIDVVTDKRSRLLAEEARLLTPAHRSPDLNVGGIHWCGAEPATNTVASHVYYLLWFILSTLFA